MSDSRILAGGILCAGFGTRLDPLTKALPKPLLPFLNTPIVTYALGHLATLGVERAALNLHHHADAIPPVVDRLAAQLGVRPVYSYEWEILGSAGGIRGLWRALEERPGTLVVLNGDTVMNVDLAAHLETHRREGNQVTLVARAKADGHPGRVWLDAEGRLQGLRDYRRPAAADALEEFEFTGIHIIETEAIANVPMEFGDVIDAVYGPMLEQDAAIGVSVADGFWAALDNPQLFLQTTREVLERPGLFEQAPLPEPLSDKLYVYRPGTIDDSAKFSGPVFTGMNVTVGAGARLGPNVVLDGVDVAEGAEISNAVIYGMGRIEGEWRDCIAVAGKVAQLPSS